MRMLDLYSCQGIGALGYGSTGLFETIIGMDTADMQKHYPYTFQRGDALACNYELLLGFDFIHASPPCQGYSKATPKAHKYKHPRLIAATHQMLYASGLPYVIENVEGSGQELRPNLVISGRDVGLPMERKRYFYVHGLQCSKEEFLSRIAGKFEEVKARKNISPNGSEYVSRDTLMRAFALHEMPAFKARRITKYGIEQGIPPRMTQAIANILFNVW